MHFCPGYCKLGPGSRRMQPQGIGADREGERAILAVARAGGLLFSSPAVVAVVFAVACLLWCPPGAPLAQVRGRENQNLVAFTRATEAIRRHQTAEGYWTTSVTRRPVFDGPTTEVNVFTPAVIVDLLDPVAREVGLTGELTRGREYLRRQIEGTGLVRYHGNPGVVANPGCEIPPDADDTALVWRIAPKPDEQLRSAARHEIERYRDDDGLYRTWLAGDDAYRCFYSRYAGHEWNPPDVAVEMHIYLFLAGHDARAARRLCDALGKRMDEDRIWVWYTIAPVLPLVREIDLARKGCSLRVPQGRVERAVTGQEPYVRESRLLRSLLLDEGPGAAARSSSEPYLRALRDGAAHGFAHLEKSPPLLYHNDLSATPPHYHWSEDFGYALWLRLYVETARLYPGVLPLPALPGRAQ